MQQKRSHPIASALVWILLIAASIGTYLIITSLDQTSEYYQSAEKELQKPAYSGSVGSVKIDDEAPFNIPSWSLFQTGNIWTLISKAKPVEKSFVPETLVILGVAHGDAADSMKVAKKIDEPLKKLFAAAKKDGVDLAVSSAYRSSTDQQEILEEFTQIQGESVARQYVAEPGKSEHQSGLAVDLSDNTPACLQNSDDCSLSSASAQWLIDNAHNYGFIQRYPPGSSSITGVAYERWHYRYVGIPLARAIHDSNLTFDEFVELAR
jgi:D-alanyl-D-alanine carboxypeptidase